jgi:hypothetical protein
MNRSTVTFGEALAAVSGVLLLLVMFALTWFSVDVTATSPDPVGIGMTGSGSENATAFEALPGVSIVLVACVVLFVVLPLLGGPAAARVIAFVGVVASVLIAISIIQPPGHPVPGYDLVITAQIGAYVGLGLAVLAFIGGLLGIRQTTVDARALGQVADQL